MNHSQDESRIRALLGRVKQADATSTPAFDELLNRPRPPQRWNPRNQIAAACCVAAALMLAVLVGRQTDTKTKNERQPLAEVQPAPDADLPIDFDLMRRLVDEHFRSPRPANEQLTVWSSNTEILLAVQLDQQQSNHIPVP